MRVLIVEPHSDQANALLDFIRSILPTAEIHLATDGLAAYDLFSSLSPDICLIEVILPVQNGWDLIGRIRRHEEDNKKVPATLITLTSIGHAINLAMAKPFSVDYTFDKPLDDQERQRLIAILQK